MTTLLLSHDDTLGHETPRGHRVSVFMEVAGLGDYLPKYAGNLDIMTAAACRTAEMFAEEILAGKFPTQIARAA